ncbi:hypothetical protein GOV11_01400 [Candidatus Woesearchaeota archaeon]|nr:hypothetical protein [Candidatus Woesearchaeota archaeon]
MVDALSQVKVLKSKGTSNNDIIKELQGQGFSSSQIFNALSQQMTSPGMTPPPSAGTHLNTPQPMAAPMNAYGPTQPQYEGATDTEELIEAIIDEKWNDLMGDINKVIAWKDSTEERITKFEQRLDDIKQQFDQLHQAVIGKIGEYDKNILDVGAEVKAMEKVFAKVLPVFTDNVAELSRIANVMKVPQKK